MKEHKITGLSCGHCALKLQEQIQQLPGGGEAKVQFNSSKIILDEKMDIDAVRSVLSAENVRFESDGKPKGPNWLMIGLYVSVASFLAALSAEWTLNQPYIPILLYAIATITSGYPTFIKGLRNLTKFKFDINTLMTVALIGAVAIGEWKEAGLVAILFGINELLESYGMEKARRSMETLLEAAPKEALLLKDGQTETVSIEKLKVDDIVLVKTGQKIPSDGMVVYGKSSVNEAAITGESLPIEKENGEPVFGGSINNEGVLHVKVTKMYNQSALSKILALVQEAQESKTPTELFINRFANYYTPIIMIISALVMLVPPLLFNGEWGEWFYQGLAVLIVGCPCALILSSPIAILSGITVNARNGILIKGGAYLEQLGKIDVIAFDKTGTLTLGEPHVVADEAFHPDFYKVAYAIEKSSSHPLAKAVIARCRELGIEDIEPDEIKTVSGQGITAIVDGVTYRLGNEKIIGDAKPDEEVIKVIHQYKEDGNTIVLVASETEVLGVFAIADEIRKESADIIRDLQQNGVKETVMLTGDHPVVAEKVAQRTGVSAFFGGLLPEEKVEKIKNLKTKGKVAMIGDGINDAPALATADLGIAMGKGTDSAIETADIVLMQDHLGKLPDAVHVSRKVNRIIKWNIGLSLGLKVLALLLTIPGWLTLWIAILSDMGATILVTLISLTVLLHNRK
ncbi:heavy metal translocating P-type ATPase [Fictibacillus barbaricus]|uniref:Cd(2+)-exporting ATPase n=1 Tax=Fictibacillus barbaricus TaxID=182136 RepID=A0ABS2Z908_9BACL|nr:cation-translocating P-type ATPase [Fictibacillus barbaricus]MBN3544642.1 cadmium-translocating P-type ATPase [Fictibacillus barbaricus]GGB65106.1 putative cadmium-transporting ATPase [Fictibacillus barbaricus]